MDQSRAMAGMLAPGLAAVHDLPISRALGGAGHVPTRPRPAKGPRRVSFPQMAQAAEKGVWSGGNDCNGFGPLKKEGW